jgi:putative oxidoreductase
MMSDTTLGATSARSATGVMARDWGLLFLRLVLGIIFVAHGSQKVFGAFHGPGLAGTVAFMGHMGIPAPLAYLASFTELLGGLAVIIGLLSRLAALGLAIDMLVAIFLVHLPNGFFGQPNKPGFEFPLAMFGMALALLFTGPGRIAVADLEPRWFGRRGNKDLS